MTRSASLVRPLARGVACLCLAAGLNGCHRKQPPAPLPVVVQAPEVTPPPAPASPKMPSPPPASVTSAPPVKVTQVQPRRKPKKSVAKPAADTPVPVETASTLPPEAAAIGELSTGSESTPQRQQETAALIVASEQRLNALPPSTTGPQQAQIRKVRYFLKQARQALSTGDAEGAMTLATKAKLLIDDLTK